MKYHGYVEYAAGSSDEKIPAHWKKLALKRLVSIRITDGPHETPQFADEGVPFVSAESVWEGSIHLESMRGFISEDAHTTYSKKYCPRRNDILIVKSGSTTGKIAFVDFDTVFNIWSPLAAIRCCEKRAIPKFIFYSLTSSYFQNLIQISWSFGTQPNIGMAVIENLAVFAPPASEQQHIIDFLDRQTTRIDMLLARKRALIKKLQEKRSALISRTVTRGLPSEAARAAGFEPNPKMKPSGIEWLGDVPERWQVRKLGQLTDKVGSGKTPKGGSETYQSEGVLLIRSQNVHNAGLKLEDAVFINEQVDEEMAGTRVRSGDVLLNITGASLGRCAVVTQILGPANVNQHVCIIRVRAERAIPRFIGRAISAHALQSQIFSFEAGSSREGLNFQQVRGLLLALPPIPEQCVIVDFLDHETAKIDSLIIKVEQAIERLQEYRTALIAAAVTGKIDVRQEQSRPASRGVHA